MSITLELCEKRAKAWEAAKAFLYAKRGKDGIVSAEDTAIYEKMEEEVVNLGKEIDRLERQQALDLELSKPINAPITSKPMPNGEQKTGRASDECKQAFWKAMRNKNSFEVQNSLRIGEDSEGGYLVPDEFEKTLVEALEEENIFRTLAKVITTSSRDRKIPVVASKGTASWIDEEAPIPESDDAFDQVSVGAYKLATLIKVSEELLNDSVFNLESYIAKEFGRRIGAKEEEAFFVGNGTGKPTGIFNDGNGQYLWHPSVQAGQPDTILNRPVKTSAYIPTATAGAKVIAFGDFGYYWVADRQGRSFQRLNELFAVTGQIGFKATQRVDGKLVLPEAIKVLQMKA